MTGGENSTVMPLALQAIELRLLQLQQRVIFASAITNAFAYGLYLALAGVTFHFMARATELSPKYRYTMLIYSGLLFVTATIYMVSNATDQGRYFLRGLAVAPTIGDLSLNYIYISSPIPGGAREFSTLTADALLLYMVYIVWGGRFMILVIPTVIYLASAVTSITELAELHHVGQIYLTYITLALSTLFDLIAAGLIAGRLFRFRSNVLPLERKMHDEYGAMANLFLMTAPAYIVPRLVDVIVTLTVSYGNLLADPLVVAGACIAPNILILSLALKSQPKATTISRTGQSSAQPSSTSAAKRKPTNRQNV